ncbi:MAG: hypothetical protein LKE51_09560 [Selenomonas sp.]|nr:hypothetical protein [Selenomonas sp.]
MRSGASFAHEPQSAKSRPIPRGRRIARRGAAIRRMVSGRSGRVRCAGRRGALRYDGGLCLTFSYLLLAGSPSSAEWANS